MGNVVHRFEVRFPRWEWSVWLVDERTGTLTVFGDRGTWSYTWGHGGRGGGLCRRDFRFELLRFDEDYVEKKLSSGRPMEFDEEETRKAWLSVVLNYRRSGRNREWCRELFDGIKALDGERDFLNFLDVVDGALRNDLAEVGHSRVVGQLQLDALMSKHWPAVRSQMQARILGERSLAWFRREVSLGSR